MPQHPDRVIPLQSSSNFRDLGGYAGHNGRPLRWRRLFRSAHLSGLSAADYATLAQLGISRSFDFRGSGEADSTPYDLPGLRRHSLAIEPSVVQRMHAMTAAGQGLTAPVVTELMRDLYRDLVNNESQRYAELFAHLLDNDAPGVFHCTAGKDRTGFAAALILLALGVSRDTVMADYLLSNQFYKRPTLPVTDTPPEALAVLWQVQQGFLDASLQVVDQDQGGVARYLAHRLGLGPAALDRLAALYLQPG